MPTPSNSFFENWDASGMTSEIMPCEHIPQDSALQDINEAISLLERENFPMMSLSYLFTGSLWLMNQFGASEKIITPFIMRTLFFGAALASNRIEEIPLDDDFLTPNEIEKMKQIGSKLNIVVDEKKCVKDLLEEFKSKRTQLEEQADSSNLQYR